MVWDFLKEQFGQKKVGVEGGKAAVASIVSTAKRLYNEGYREKAVTILQDAAENLKREADRFQERLDEYQKQHRKPDDLESFRKQVERKTKDEIEGYADEEFGIDLTTDDLKREMIDQFIDELERRDG